MNATPIDPRFAAPETAPDLKEIAPATPSRAAGPDATIVRPVVPNGQRAQPLPFGEMLYLWVLARR